MKILFLFIVCVAGAYAQRASGVVVVFSVPSGACPANSPMRYYSPVNTYWGCKLPSQASLSGTWTVLTSGGTPGTVTSVAFSTNLGTVTGSPVTGSGTLTDTVSAAQVVGLFSGCSGVLYLGADGACHAAGAGSVTTISGSGPAWLTWNIATPTTTPVITLTATTGQTSHQVIGTCNALTAFAPCSLVAGDLPTLSTTVNGTTCTIGSTCTVTSAPSGTAGGDLSGTYPNPTVAKVNGNTPGGTCTNQVTRSIDSSGRPTCATVQNADMANVATTVNSQTCTLGSTCTVTAAPTGTAGGDLSGSYPNPTVAKVNGNTPGNTCTNQFERSIDSSGRGTCATVDNASLANSSVTVNGATCTLGSSCTPVNGLISLFHGNAANLTVPSASTLFLGQSTAANANEDRLKYPAPQTGHLKFLTVFIIGTQPATGTYVCTARINGVNTSIVATFSAGTVGPASASDYTNSAAISQGQQVSIGCLNNASTTSATTGGWSIGLIP